MYFYSCEAQCFSFFHASIKRLPKYSTEPITSAPYSITWKVIRMGVLKSKCSMEVCAKKATRSNTMSWRRLFISLNEKCAKSATSRLAMNFRGDSFFICIPTKTRKPHNLNICSSYENIRDVSEIQSSLVARLVATNYFIHLHVNHHESGTNIHQKYSVSQLQ
jgi:hypothetical protein